MAENKKKVLIIEDEARNMKLEKDLLEMSGYEVLCADNAEDGIVMAREQQPDVIVSDYQLPGLNGIQAQQILAKDEKTKNIPLAFVTASVTQEQREMLAKSGCQVISKPINTRTFAKDVEALIR
jgi:two-component system, cell cycle response regulator DivK